MSEEPDSITALRLKVQNGEIDNARTIDFAWSLIRQFEKKGSLSVKQMEWVEKIVNATPAGSHPALDFIRKNLDAIKPKEREFVDSLIDQWDTKGFFSAKQDWWVSKIAGDIAKPKPARKPQPPAKGTNIVRSNNDDLVSVELRPNVWAVIDTTTNTILGTYDSEADAQQALNR